MNKSDSLAKTWRRNMMYCVISKNLPILIILVIIVSLSSCTTPIEVESGSLEGRVSLDSDTNADEEDVADCSGVLVALYKTLNLNTEIVDLNKNYPNLGIKISQETEFDHRFNEPIVVTKTSSDGKFKFKDVSVGSYNLIALKDGWGSREIYNIDIYKGYNNINNYLKEDIKLYKEMIISGLVDYEVIMLPHHHYVIEDDVYVVAGGHLSIPPYATVRINQGKSINFLGGKLTVNSSEGFFKISSNDSFFCVGGITSIEKFDGVKIYEGSIITESIIQGGIIKGGGYCLYNQISGLSIMNMRIEGEFSGIYLHGNQSSITCELRNIVASNTNLSGQPAVALHGLSNVVISDFIVFDNNIGISVREVGNAEISNCYLNNKNIDIKCYNGSKALMHNCSFYSKTGIENSRGSEVVCFFNDFYTSIGIDNILVGSTTGFPYTAYITANNNNFYCTQLSVRTRARFYSKDVIYFDVTNNYWDTESEQDIRRRIWDRGNEDMAGPQYDQLMAVFKYVPFRITPISNTGVVRNNGQFVLPN
jgi:hypothetical protein